MKKVIKFNTGYLVDFGGVACVAALFYMQFGREDAKAIRFIAIAIGVLFLALVLNAFTDTKLTNESGTSVFTKPEEGEEPNEVKPNETLYGLDGVKTKGKVYKLVDGTHATVTETGKVKIHSIFGKLVNSIRGGELTSPPDNGWQKLFEK